ncbi:CRISPR-associated protein Cas1 [Fusobacterium nucleatum YWH7199]|uniref:CRISPR-associated endonuclease Cas1 n=1 Tax=Fusobacterium nucleatum TaxID=851 RepID=A0A133NAB9_FUSNU|nr:MULTISPECIES: type II CRISPR-associated endonuclease Cas1 [Fusobacterium]KXA13254.1 CRISPR-associated endonuclease Cas1, NMENI subtype [Fusobacterium nucleatum]MCL4575833.1 CRISPR-associated protein Cas1 [Fusobacterium nucleatum YWH7056]MCL4581856.1 CRISPR-associated protein Cas1 [Fusobacterium nucleatum YWH7199]MCL4583594.1 CRISPR-associated protein Cas1 [Fusobacterium nucleatum YWH7054]MCL4592377.1 CRISPR-associated protein Cas1 [Fusobacterium nucleatum YWH7053]
MSGWRVIVVTGRSKLDLRYNSISIRRDNGTDFIHIGEVNTLILETTTISITAALMCELIKQKVKVIFCDEKSNPHFELLPFYGSHDCSAKIKEQIAWTDFLKESLWTVIVTEKVENQMKLLKKLNKEEYRILEEYLSQIEHNDSTNREGHSAKIYFSALFGNNFSRNKENSLNAFLNYGYQLLLSAFNKEIVANGYLTQIGIFHKNMFNYYNLSSDLMEPFRVIVDELAYKENPQKFEKDEKRKLQNILNLKFRINNVNHYLSDVIKIYTKSIFDALSSNDLSLVRFFQDEL